MRYNFLRGETWIPLPKELANKRAIINVKNKDNKCFLWCVLRALNPKADNAERVGKELKTKENTLNMEGIEYPVSLKDLNEFEKQNPSISITVFGYERKSVYPLRNSANTGKDYDIILMLIEEGVKHYCLVKSIERLLSSQASKGKRKEYFCLNCFNPFPSEKSLNKHKEYCNEHKAVKIQMPEKGTMLKFKNYHRSERFLSSFTLTLSALLNRYNHATQMIKKVIPNNTKNTNHLAFAIISNALMIRYIKQK